MHAIEDAFPVGPPPDDDAMRNDHCDECRGTVVRFAGKRWPDVSIADLSGNPGAMFLTATGFQYYLPAMMLRSIEAPTELDCFPDSVVGQLSPPGGKASAHDHAFNANQVAAILAFLLAREASEQADGASADWPEEAVALVPVSRPLARAITHWRKRLGRDE